MPPKKLSNLKSISIDSHASKSRDTHSRDLITHSQAALLSSQATIHTQRTQSSQNMSYGSLADDFEFINREEIGEVFISKEQEILVQQILQISRKGKINKSNAFEIPIKVMNISHDNRERSTNGGDVINNKFWKFAAELLSVSLNVYDKRVENMMISTNSMQNRLSRININIKGNRGSRELDQDDALLHQENQEIVENEERRNLLSIKTDDFATKWMPANDEFALNTLEFKDKFTIKNIENVFIADPVFLKTQKMFDSGSVKSLMLNIFSIGSQHRVELFNGKNDNENQKKTKKQKSSTFPKLRAEKMDFDETQKQAGEFKQKSDDEETRMLESISENQPQNLKHLESIGPALENQFDKGSFLLRDASLFSEIERFMKNAAGLKQYYAEKNQRKVYLSEDEQMTSLDKVLMEDQVIFKDLYENMEYIGEDKRQPDFLQIGVDEVQSMPVGMRFSTEQSDQMMSLSHGMSQYSAHTSCASDMFELTSQQTFYGMNKKTNQMELIMPWQIQFKNQKMLKKKKSKKKGTDQSEKQSKQRSKKSKKSDFRIEFDIGFQSKEAVLRVPKVHTKASRKIQNSLKLKKEKNLQPRQFEAEIEYHVSHYRRQKSAYEEQLLNKASSQGQYNLDQISGGKVDQSSLFNGQDSAHPNAQDPFMKEKNSFPFSESNQIFSDEFNMQTTECIGHRMGVANIREVKKFVYNQVIEKKQTTVSQLMLLLPFSVAQIFTIFLHLMNEHPNFLIGNYGDDQRDVYLGIEQIAQVEEIHDGDIQI